MEEVFKVQYYKNTYTAESSFKAHEGAPTGAGHDYSTPTTGFVFVCLRAWGDLRA